MLSWPGNEASHPQPRSTGPAHANGPGLVPELHELRDPGPSLGTVEGHWHRLGPQPEPGPAAISVCVLAA